MSEWPLLIFTLLVQASVGLTLFGAWYSYWMAQELAQEQHFTTLRPLLLMVCLMAGTGLLASVAHLGYPLNAFHALRHVGTSWLSREILFASLYLGIMCLVTLLALLTRRIQPALLAIGGLVGLADVYCMAEIYFHSTVIGWMHIHTHVSFYSAVIALGAVLALLFASRAVLSAPLVRRLLVTTLLLTAASAACQLLVMPDYLHQMAQRLASQPVTLPFDMQLAFQHGAALRLLSWILLLGGLTMLLWMLYRNNPRAQSPSRILLSMAAGLVMLAHVASRYAFFTLH
ncbi:DmsC/YnfH family molybdoenzyme membrane anchor subunit [Nissabacter sp. SGAir0207]|uniref:dimethyl sulfoxide reductase anchor subunit family protein n=1 Tax=Nissabacter sp. SGAir0207 TaxID=2126321 RepID=UPI0010CD6B59|nr:DmsC/YnfH family molybdoenzyme membrane anchor subunit [Nissabacter sp. SGAir0207]QCR37729.1 dimethyl sulfoxide reductase [Nissabacter sp. SGAir0207]